jgi:alginate O-acetyltransferase complex protein AlgI
MLTVYFDLSAYSDMAVGLAGIFGFKLQSNFNYPFAAASVTDFFRRWHITVTDFFFRRLPQIPGFSKLRGFGAAVIMLVFGLWHGAQIRFLLWGAFFAVIITLETLIGKARLKKIPSPIRRVATIVLVTVGFGALAFPDWQTLSAYLKALVGKGAGLWLARDIENVAEFMPLAVLSALMTLPTAKIIGRKAARSPIGEAALYTAQIIFTLAMLALAAVMLAGTDVRDFLCIKL